MFTGIIAGTGTVAGKRTVGGGIALELKAHFDLIEPEEGESIAVSGVCLTAYNISGRTFHADVSPETLSRTKLGTLGVGGQVNLERALQLSSRLGGHIVSGHIDCLAIVKRIDKAGDYTIYNFSLPGGYDRYIIEKGSITVDGISLTVNSCQTGQFSVSIIPHTMKMTTLGSLRAGNKVNIEVDVIGKYVEKLLSPRQRDGSADASEVTAELLLRNGFL
jgi:riboflavin synthase